MRAKKERMIWYDMKWNETNDLWYLKIFMKNSLCKIKKIEKINEYYRRWNKNDA